MCRLRSHRSVPCHGGIAITDSEVTATTVVIVITTAAEMATGPTGTMTIMVAVIPAVMPSTFATVKKIKG